MMSERSQPTTNLPLSQRLKAATRSTHEGLDQRIMAFQPFASLERYAAFLQVQYRFHRDVAPLFENPRLDHLLPGLRERQRLAAVAADLSDLGAAMPTGYEPALFPAGAALDLPTALGWLYVEAGSNLGAAFLFKAAAGLGLHATHGARHLAPQAGGRAPSWKEFAAQLDAVPLAPDAVGRAELAARAAFDRVRDHVQRFCPVEAAP